MTRFVLDSGALIALERNERPMWVRLTAARQQGVRIVTHAGVVGQVWRRPARQVLLARALRAVAVEPITDELGRLAGQLLAATRTSDVIDAALVVLARSGDRIYTSDADDLFALAAARRVPGIEIVPV